MEEPLWIDRYAPTLSELPQDDAREYLQRAVDEPMNLVVRGPTGSGKTAAVRALAREAHGSSGSGAGMDGTEAAGVPASGASGESAVGDSTTDAATVDGRDPGSNRRVGETVPDLIEINVADFFERTKSEITNDPRFEPFLTGRSTLSKRDMINHVVKEAAGYAPVSGSSKTILLDNAEAIREDFQQALRRLMERHHRTTQFVIATRQPSVLIPPIRSRCVPVVMRAPTSEEIVAILEGIVEAEAVEYDADGLEFVAGYADGDLREAILAAQTTALEADAITMEAAYEVLGDVGLDEAVDSMLEDAEAGDFADARKTLDALLVDEGIDGEAVLETVLAVGRKRYDERTQARLHRLAADVEFGMHAGTSDRIHVSTLLAELGREA